MSKNKLTKVEKARLEEDMEVISLIQKLFNKSKDNKNITSILSCLLKKYPLPNDKEVEDVVMDHTFKYVSKSLIDKLNVSSILDLANSGQNINNQTLSFKDCKTFSSLFMSAFSQVERWFASSVILFSTKDKDYVLKEGGRLLVPSPFEEQGYHMAGKTVLFLDDVPERKGIVLALDPIGDFLDKTSEGQPLDTNVCVFDFSVEEKVAPEIQEKVPVVENKKQNKEEKTVKPKSSSQTKKPRSTKKVRKSKE